MSDEVINWRPGRGPWWIEGQFDAGISVEIYDADKHLVVSIEPYNDGEWAPQEIANARLLAAAPELYDALALYVHHFGDPLQVARPALAKARGESL